MPADPLKLQALTLQAIRAANAKLPNAAAWERAMRAALTTGHTAAHLSGLAERLNVPVDSALVSRARLTRAERADIAARVSGQLDYLAKFKGDLAGMSDAAITARADLYSGATRATFYGARFPGLANVPGDGQTACRTNCQCSLEPGDGGVIWKLGASEHCTDCEALANGGPYGRE